MERGIREDVTPGTADSHYPPPSSPLLQIYQGGQHRRERGEHHLLSQLTRFMYRQGLNSAAAAQKLYAAMHIKTQYFSLSAIL